MAFVWMTEACVCTCVCACVSLHLVVAELAPVKELRHSILLGHAAPARLGRRLLALLKQPQLLLHRPHPCLASILGKKGLPRASKQRQLLLRSLSLEQPSRRLAQSSTAKIEVWTKYKHHRTFSAALCHALLHGSKPDKRNNRVHSKVIERDMMSRAQACSCGAGAPGPLLRPAQPRPPSHVSPWPNISCIGMHTEKLGVHVHAVCIS